MLNFFKKVAWFEGVSLLLLLFFAMPMKYWAGNEIYVKTIGMAHGVLFILYIVLAIVLKINQNWDLKKFLLICLASIIPFGTFYVEKKILA
ncbi:DUF3817 domain-containing protein [Flavobacterium sp.]|uniref:DUF3817 domain-containing protein n=1 Tax=Flavobacterium sp. TaxID=239 RepID=UPI0026089AE6|nr:DUF3817 domain-containing protein [Flavobacterium sp.]MDD2986423.1 DUF3817 domain-containing protein [Flavobacterium sp.]